MGRLSTSSSTLLTSVHHTLANYPFTMMPFNRLHNCVDGGQSKLLRQKSTNDLWYDESNDSFFMLYAAWVYDNKSRIYDSWMRFFPSLCARLVGVAWPNMIPSPAVNRLASVTAVPCQTVNLLSPSYGCDEWKVDWVSRKKSCNLDYSFPPSDLLLAWYI